MTVVISDIEGTLTTGSSWRALRAYIKSRKKPWIYNKFFARWIPRYLLVGLGLMSRRKAMFDWMKDEVRLFQGFSPDEFDEMAEWVVEHEMWAMRRLDLISELAEIQKDGSELVVVSSAYQPVVEAFAERMNAIPIGTPLVYKNKKLEGVGSPINAYEYKAEAVLARVGDAEILAAYGDTLSDLPMMELSREPVAVFPDSNLRSVAASNGWRIIDDAEDY